MLGESSLRMRIVWLAKLLMLLSNGLVEDLARNAKSVDLNILLRLIRDLFLTDHCSSCFVHACYLPKMRTKAASCVSSPSKVFNRASVQGVLLP